MIDEELAFKSGKLRENPSIKVVKGNYFCSQIRKIIGASEDEEGQLCYLVAFVPKKHKYFLP